VAVTALRALPSFGHHEYVFASKPNPRFKGDFKRRPDCRLQDAKSLPISCLYAAPTTGNLGSSGATTGKSQNAGRKEDKLESETRSRKTQKPANDLWFGCKPKGCRFESYLRSQIRHPGRFLSGSRSLVAAFQDSPNTMSAGKIVVSSWLNQRSVHRGALRASTTADCGFVAGWSRDTAIHHRRYRDRLRAASRWRQGEDVLARHLARRRTDAGYSVAFDLPASALPSGDCELALKGLAGDQTNDIGYYYFRVRRQ
jgi:hypothetical protein